VLGPIVAAGCHWSFTPRNHDDDDGAPWSRGALLEMLDPEACFGGGGGDEGEHAAANAAASWARRCGALCLSRGARTWDRTPTAGPTTGASCGATSVRLWLFDSGGDDHTPT
jgi:hypothetical protein